MNAAAALIGLTFFNTIGFGTPPSTVLIINNIQDGILADGGLIAVVVIYLLALFIVFESGMELLSFYKNTRVTFRTLMGVFILPGELETLRNEQYTALKGRMFLPALLCFGNIELLGAFAFLDEVTGRYLLNWVAFYAAYCLIANWMNRQRKTLRLSEDKTLIVAEKQARAMEEALQEELEDREDIGF
ncbi:MAG: hypothetical protein AAF298_02185 [Cyanobacteria bacterium P01_A01_bin.40]